MIANAFTNYYTDAKVAELAAAFKRVENADHWKKAIDTEIEGTVDEIGIVKEAITFYTGSVARVQVVGHNGTRLRVRVTAVGYYAAVGA